MGSLEKTLERDVARNLSGAHVSAAALSSAKGTEESEDDERSEAEDERDLEATPLATIDNVYEDGSDDELMDLGVQVGRLRISERLGGWIRPKLVEEVSHRLTLSMFAADFFTVE